MKEQDTQENVEHEVSPNLSEREIQEVEQRISPNAAIVHEAIRLEGEEGLRRSAMALAWSGLAAGLSMGFSLVLNGLMDAMLPDRPWRPLISSFGYSFGFLIVIMGRQQLFTENTLTAILPLLHKPSVVRFLKVLRLWGIVLAANLLGTTAFAAALAWIEPFPPEARAAFIDMGVHAAVSDFGMNFARAVFGGWLIALMVWLLPASGDAKPLIVIIITYVVGLGDLSHVIAGSVEVAYAAFEGSIGWRVYVADFLVPVLLGNTLGGVVLVSLVNYGQVHPEVKANSGSRAGQDHHRP